MKSISIIIPVHNEEGLIIDVVNKLILNLKKKNIKYEIILVENGSSDSSTLLVDKLASEVKFIKSIHLSKPNYGYALKKGFLSAKNDLVINFSIDWVDLSFLFSSLSKLSKYDMILASKNIPGSLDQRPLNRKLLGKLFHLFSKTLFGIPFQDTHGIRIFKRTAMIPVIRTCTFNNHVFETELIVRAYYKKLSILEFPAKVKEKRPARIKLFKRILPTIIQLIQLRINLWQESVNLYDLKLWPKRY